MKKNNIIILFVLVIVLACLRVIIPIENFNPIGAIALMGGMLLGRNIWALAVPLVALLLGDVILALSSPMYTEYLFSGTFMFVYIGFLAIIGAGILLRKNISIVKVLAGSVIAAVIFFVITNIGAWATLDIYTKNLSGLILSFEAAVPFFRATLISQVVFSVIIYFVYSLATKEKLALA